MSTPGDPEERAERAERASRETEHTGPHEDKRADGDLASPGGEVGGVAGAPPRVQEEARPSGGVAPVGPARSVEQDHEQEQDEEESSDR